MPEEIAIIAVVAIIGGTVSTIVKQVLEYMKSKNASNTGSDASMTTSELQTMLRSSVAEFSEPLMARMDRLEEKLDSVNSSDADKAPAKQDLLSDIDAYESSSDVDHAPSVSRRSNA